jgi:Tfp pilus assembly protein PilF
MQPIQIINKNRTMRKAIFNLAWIFTMVVGTQQVFAQTVKDGLYQLDVEQYGNASKTFKTLVQQNATGENLYYLGNYYMNVDQLDSARIQFEQGIAKDPAYALNFIGLGSVLMAKGDKVGAKAQFGKALAIKKADKNAEVWYRIGEANVIHKNNDPTEAVTALQKALAIDKNKTDAYLALGDAFLRKGDGGNAANNYEKALGVNAGLAKAHIKLGKIYVRANPNLALDKYKEAITVDPKYAPAYRELAELYFLAKQYDNARQMYEKYITMVDNSPETQFRYAGFLLLTKDYAKAQEILTKVQNNPAIQKNPVLFRLLGYSGYETKNYPVGMENINKFFSLAKPENIISSDYEYQGKLQMATGQDTVKAIALIDKAVELDTARVEAYKDLGQELYDAKHYAWASQVFEKYISKAGDKANVKDYFNMAYASYLGKDFVKSDTAFGTFITKFPDQHVGYLWKANSLARQDPDIKEGKAKPYYEKFITLVEVDPEKKEKNKRDLVTAYNWLGYYNLKLERSAEKAHAFANKALALDPANASAKQILKYKQADLVPAKLGQK